jgi:hypothetical protein
MLLVLGTRRKGVWCGVKEAELTSVAPRFSMTAILLPAAAAKEPVRGANKAEEP